jgi:imidazole glycerol-phosphate synthase subunit HisH
MSGTTITMIDYGASNIRSAYKAFEHVGARVELTGDPDVVRRASKLVLPGVGAFGAGMSALRERGLDTAVRDAATAGVPLLGICLGMQFLLEESDEMGRFEGLGFIAGRVTRFDFSDQQLKVPHMGWNQIEHTEDHPLLNNVPSGAFAYFVHSYYCVPEVKEDIVATTMYGGPFTSIVSRANVHGIQFHPEKSQKHGLQLLRNYFELF